MAGGYEIVRVEDNYDEIGSHSSDTSTNFKSTMVSQNQNENEIRSTLPSHDENTVSNALVFEIEPENQISHAETNVFTNPCHCVIHYIFLGSIIFNTICGIRLFLLPTIIITTFGGPFFLITPWCLWLLVGSTVVVIFCCWPETSRETFSENLKSYFKAACLHFSQSSCRSEMLLCAGRYRNVSHQSCIFVSALMLWGFIDFVLTGITLAISVIFVVVIFVDDDGLVVYGWGYQYRILIAEIFFCCASLVCSLVSSISGLYLYCKQRSMQAAEGVSDSDMASVPSFQHSTTTPAEVDGEANTRLKPKLHADIVNITRKVLFFTHFLMALLGLALTSACLHIYLRGKYYSTHKTATFSNCDPMIEKACSLPYPSSYWLVEDSTTETGYRVNIGNLTMPYTKRGIHVSPSAMNQYDGFSVSGAILWHLQGVRDAELISFQDIDHSLLINSSSLLMEAQSGRFHPHFTEVDHLSDGHSKIAYVMPAKSMLYNTQYVVVIKGLTDSTGRLLRPSHLVSSYILAYQSASPPSSVANDPRYIRLLPVFEQLENAGVDLGTIQLIWDFHTASQTSILGKITGLYDATIARTEFAIAHSATYESVKAAEKSYNHGQDNTGDKRGSDGSGGGPWGGDERLGSKKGRARSPTVASASWLYEEVNITYTECTHANMMRTAAVRAYYRVNVPWFLESFNREKNFVRADLVNLAADEAGAVPIGGQTGLLIQVVNSGDTVWIPCTVAKGLQTPTALLEFGHGIFSTRSDSRASFLVQEANTMGWLLWAMDWRGFSRFDLPLIARVVLNNAGDVQAVEAAVIQGFVSKVGGRLIVRHILSKEQSRLHLLSNSPSGAAFNASEVALPSRFMGDSMGSILGGGYSAFARYPRSVFLVAGSPFTFLVGRSDIFQVFQVLADWQLYSRVDLRIVLTSWQIVFDAGETTGWAHSGRYDNADILIQLGLGDSTVTTISGRIFALNVNATLLEPAVFPVAQMHTQWGPIPHLPGPSVTPTRNLTAAPASTTQQPPESSSLHSAVEGKGAAQDPLYLPDTSTMYAFLQGPESKMPESRARILGSAGLTPQLTSRGVKVLFQVLFPGDSASLPTDSQIPTTPTNVHYCIPLEPTVMWQNSVFLEYGMVKNPCGNGACVLSKHATC